MTRKPWSRKRKIVTALLALCALVLFYAVFIEARWLQIERVDLHLTKLPLSLDGFRIVQLSDFHYPSAFGESFIQRVVSTANQLQPDVIVLTGDYITRAASDADACARILGGLKARYGVIAVLGNHDYWTNSIIVQHALEQNGIIVLRNQAIAVKQGGAQLWFVGLNDYWQREADLSKALRRVPASAPTILLVHEPDFADEAVNYPIDLQLSGHSHGGLLWIPGIGSPHLPYLSHKYPRGLYQVGKMYLYTNRGIGSIPLLNIPFRLNDRPEVTLLTLHAGDGPPHPTPQVKHH